MQQVKSSWILDPNSGDPESGSVALGEGFMMCIGQRVVFCFFTEDGAHNTLGNHGSRSFENGFQGGTIAGNNHREKNHGDFLPNLRLKTVNSAAIGGRD